MKAKRKTDDDQEAKDRRMDAAFAGKPSLRELEESGELSKEGVPGGVYRQLQAVRFRLKEERERRGWSLAQLAEAAAIDAPALSRFERGVIPQPTFATVWSIARALGLDFTIALTPLEKGKPTTGRPTRVER